MNIHRAYLLTISLGGLEVLNEGSSTFTCGNIINLHFTQSFQLCEVYADRNVGEATITEPCTFYVYARPR